MPRIRSLKPEFATDAKLATVSRDARLTFVLMISQADDHGFLAGSHRQLLGQLYPLDDEVSAAVLIGWVEELVGIGVVRWRSTTDGVPVVQLVNWSKHQRVDNAGRSQLAAMLAPEGTSPHADADSAADVGESPQVAEVRGDSPQVAELRRSRALGPRTSEDLGTEDRVLSAAVAFAVRANQGLADHATHPQPVPRIIGTSLRTHAVAKLILDAGVPQKFAEQAIYDLAKHHNAEGQVRSLGYFSDAVIRRWQESEEGAAASGVRPLVPLSQRQSNDVASRTFRNGIRALEGL